MQRIPKDWRAPAAIRNVGSEQDLLTQREVDSRSRETLNCYDEGAIEQEDMAAFAALSSSCSILPSRKGERRGEGAKRC